MTLRQVISAAGIVFGLGLLLTAQAQATQVLPAGAICAERELFLEGLQKSFGEAPVSAGLASSGNMIEVLRAEDGRFTILETRPDGTTCVMADGEAWTTMEAQPEGEPS
ncbi:MAG: hypothetical protein ACPGOV_16565 [Magnetovibrionaceae bacterium]